MNLKRTGGKNSHLHFFLTTEHHQRISQEAKNNGITISEYARIKLGEEYDLNDKAFSILKKCRNNSHGTILYNQIFTKLCTHFSISKEECRSLLRRFEKEGKINYVKQKGIRIKVLSLNKQGN